MNFFRQSASNSSPKIVFFMLTLLLFGPSLVWAGDELEGVRTLLDQSELASAREILLRVVTEPNQESRATLLLCELETLAGNGDAGYQYGQKAVTLLPEESNAYYWLAKAIGVRIQAASFFNRGALSEEMQKAMKKAVELDPHNLDALVLQAEFYANAPAMGGGSMEKALKILEGVKAQDPVRADNALGLIYLSRNEFDAAEKVYRASLNSRPEDMEAQYGLAFAIQNQKHYKEAEKLFAAIGEQAGKTYYKALYQLARTKILGGYEIPEAIKLLEQYIAAAPSGSDLVPIPAAYWRKGLAHEQLKEYKQAGSSYQAALAIDPGYKPASSALDNIKSKL